VARGSSKADEAEVKSEVRAPGRLTEPTLAAVDALDVDSIVLGLCSDVRPLGGLMGMVDWRLCGRLSRLIEAGTITGAVGEKILFPTGGRLAAPRLFIYGWGPHVAAKNHGAEILKGMVEMLDKARVKRIAFALPEPARPLLYLMDDVEKVLGARLGALFAPDPIPPI
jgi:hypothetical protein